MHVGKNELLDAIENEKTVNDNEEWEDCFLLTPIFHNL